MADSSWDTQYIWKMDEEMGDNINIDLEVEENT
jgi:hypothetical protein